MHRLKFLRGEQRKFIVKSCNGLSLKEFLKNSELKIPYSTFKQYAREHLTLPLSLAKELARISNQNLSDYKTELMDENWGAVKGGKIGIINMQKKYKNKLKSWRIKGWKAGLIKFAQPKNLKEVKIDKNLAEFIGAYLGDGTLTKYFIRIFGDKRYDYHYFGYLSSMIEFISGIRPKIRAEKDKNLLILDIKSKLLCDYFKNKLGFTYGDKIRNKTVIPQEIINDKKLMLHCLRGLIDTDGTVSKDGEALCIRFVSHSPPLMKQIRDANKKLNIFTFNYKTVIGTRNISKIDEFFKVVGSSNLSNIIRYCEFKNGNLLKKEETLNYHPAYRNIKIPYGPVV